MATRETVAAGDENPEIVFPETKKAPTKAWDKAKPKGKRKNAKARATAHVTREAETREATAGYDDSDAPWVQPSSLDAPKPRPGMVQRWIRAGIRGKDDPINLNNKTREGWRPRLVSSFPKNYPAVGMKSGQFPGAFVVNGMVLMEMPADRNAQRNAYYKKKQGKMTESINSQLAEASRGRSTGFGAIEMAQRSVPVRVRQDTVAAGDE